MDKEHFFEKINTMLIGTGIEFFLSKSKNNFYSALSHFHEALEFIYVDYGDFTVFLDDKILKIQKGDLIFFRPLSVHSVVSGNCPANAYYVLKLRPSLLFDFAASGKAGEYILKFFLNSASEQIVWRESDEGAEAIFSSFKKFISFYGKSAYGSDIATKAAAAELMYNVLYFWQKMKLENFNTDDKTAHMIYNAIMYIGAHYKEDITAESCSKYLYISYSYFTRTFKKVTGKSFRSYLNTIRLSHAENLLVNTNKSVTDIAYECGYNNLSYFISVYKKTKGITPSQVMRCK